MSQPIAVIVGSLRRESINRRLAQALVRLPAAQDHTFEFPACGTLPLFNQDEEADPGEAVTAFRETVLACRGVLFVTPEYNRSIPGVLKNAIDHASRPYGRSVWKGKPAAIIGASQGATATAMAQQHLRGICHYLDMPMLMQPETYMRWTDGLVTDEGTIGAESRDFLDAFMAAFLAHVETRAPAEWRQEGTH